MIMWVARSIYDEQYRDFNQDHVTDIKKADLVPQKSDAEDSSHTAVKVLVTVQEFPK